MNTAFWVTIGGCYAGATFALFLLSARRRRTATHIPRSLVLPRLLEVYSDVKRQGRAMKRAAAVESLFRDNERARRLYDGPVWRVEADSDREAIDILLGNQ